MNWLDATPPGWLCPHTRRGFPEGSGQVDMGRIKRDAAGRLTMFYPFTRDWKPREFCYQCGWIERPETARKK